MGSKRDRMSERNNIVKDDNGNQPSFPSPPSSIGLEGGGGRPPGKVLPRKVKLLTAAAIFYGNVVFGCALNTYGPALTSFERKYGVDDETIARVFTICTGGVLLGALSSGFLFKLVNRQLAVAAFMGGMGAVMFLTPHCPTLTWFFVATGVMGIFTGFYASAQFVWIMEMMQKDCPPYVQSQHFFYALGTIISTLIMAPFLDREKDYNYYEMVPGDEWEGRSSSTSKLFVPYSIVGGLLLISMLVQIILFTCFRYHPPPPEGVNIVEEGKGPRSRASLTGPGTTPASKTWPKIRMIFLSCCFFGALQGMEICVIQFLPKFGQNSELGLSESESTYVLTGLTGAYAVGRFICIFIVFKVSSQLLVCGNIVISLVANVLLIGWANDSLPMLWTASILFGLGFSSAFASYSAYLERYLQVTDGIGALIMVCGSGVASAYPLIIGRYIGGNPVVLGYTAFCSIGICALAFGTSSYLTHKDKTRY